MGLEQISLGHPFLKGFAGGSVVKNPPAKAGDAREVGLIPGLEDPLEEEKATHPSILAWKIPWTEEPDGLHTIHGVSESDTIEQLSTHAHTPSLGMSRLDSISFRK